MLQACDNNSQVCYSKIKMRNPLILVIHIHGQCVAPKDLVFDEKLMK